MLIFQILLIVVLLAALALLLFNLITIPFYAYAMIRGAFYAPTSQQKVATMFKLAHKYPIKHMVDIGSGDGRIVAAFAQAGILADGLEINPILVFRSRWKIWQAHLKNKAHIYLQDFWFVDFGKYDLVTVYGIRHIMPKLEKKLNTELKSGAIVLSNGFTFPSWKPILVQDGIHVYQKK